MLEIKSTQYITTVQLYIKNVNDRNTEQSVVWSLKIGSIE